MRLIISDNICIIIDVIPTWLLILIHAHEYFRYSAHTRIKCIVGILFHHFRYMFATLHQSEYF